MSTLSRDPVGQQHRRRLDSHYLSVRDLLLARQSGTLGLIPAFGSDYGWVRDNVYCSAAIWALALAYRRIDDDKGRTYELEQSAVKCMRGILFCYMQQSHKVERFKALQSSKDSLHCRFHHITGDASHDDEDYGHLQIDATSLFLLFLSQMTTSGLQIIYTMDEVNFIQNLVYYIERAYRTPDYGMWERGSKDNNNSRELHASSIGMAKAALEVINGLDLFGSDGNVSSTIYVDPDAHNRNRMILGSLLPRESSSKETDAGLLAITGYPAFAVDDRELKSKTVDRILTKLKGECGFKRFLRDGQFTPLEDKSRKYYGPAELRQFDGIECEWPMFFVYLMLDALFKGDKQTADEYHSKLHCLMVSTPHGVILPRYYMISGDFVVEEKAQPGTQPRIPDPEQTLFLWGLSLYIIAYLLCKTDELVTVGELDPLERHIRPMFRTHSVKQHSSLKTARSDVIVQVALIAENSRLQASLAMYGIETQTLTQVEPIHVLSPTYLIELYSKLGINEKLGLSGRPSRPVGALGTSKVYRIMGRTISFYPIILDQSDFYMSHDMSLLLYNIRNIISFIHENWNMQGRPTVVLLLRENTLRGEHFSEALELMAELKRGYCSGARIRLDRLQPMVSASCVEHLDFIVERDSGLAAVFSHEMDTPPLMRHRSRSSLSHAPGLFEQVLTSQVKATKENELIIEEEAKGWSTDWLVDRLHDTSSVEGRLIMLKILYFREGGAFDIGPSESVLDVVDQVYREAGDLKLWKYVRLAASLLKKLVDSLAPAISTMLVCGKQVTLGVPGFKEHVISAPIGPFEIKDIMYNEVQQHSIYEAVLQQELVIFLSSYISSSPQTFEGMLRIRIGWILQAMKNELCEDDEQIVRFFQELESLSPNAIKTLLHKVVNPQETEQRERSWLQKRQLSGALNKVPPNFYDKVYAVLEKTKRIQVAGNTLEQHPLIYDMARGDMTFALKVEETLKDVSPPEYRQIVVELLIVISVALERNPEVEFHQSVDINELISSAVELFLSENCEFKHVGKAEGLKLFFNTPPFDRLGTTSYLARVVNKQLLLGGVHVGADVECVVQ